MADTVRERALEAVTEALMDGNWLTGGSDPEEVVEALVAAAVLFPEERWDEDCHACERRIGDHTVDGRCP